MKKIKKIYLPRWQRYVVVPFFVVLWLIMGYIEFFSPEKGEIGTPGFALMTIVFLGVSVMLWLMTSGKLPAYTMEEETDEETPGKQHHISN